MQNTSCVTFTAVSECAHACRCAGVCVWPSIMCVWIHPAFLNLLDRFSWHVFKLWKQFSDSIKRLSCALSLSPSLGGKRHRTKSSWLSALSRVEQNNPHCVFHHCVCRVFHTSRAAWPPAVGFLGLYRYIQWWTKKSRCFTCQTPVIFYNGNDHRGSYRIQ